MTTRRIVVETGLLSKRLEQVDLYRVNDYTVLRPLGQRLMGTGTLVLRTLDKGSPEVTLDGIKSDVVGLLRASARGDRGGEGQARRREADGVARPKQRLRARRARRRTCCSARVVVKGSNFFTLPSSLFKEFILECSVLTKMTCTPFSRCSFR